MTVAGWIELGFAGALLLAVGCGGSDSGGTPVFGCGDGGLALASTVVMTCGAGNSVDTQTVTVILGGPLSGSVALRELNFDITYDPAALTFAPSTSYVSTLFPAPGAVVAVALANGVEGRVIVSLQQVAGSPDITVAPGQHNVLSLTFKRVPNASFGPTPLTFENAEALPPPATFTFTNGLMLAYQ